MKQITSAMASGTLAGLVRLGINRQRVEEGKRPLARSHQPFNRRRPSFGEREIAQITDAARHQGLGREQQFELRRYLYDMRRKEAAELKEEFMLFFNAAYQAARDRIWAAADAGELRAPRTAIDVYTTVCQTAPPLSNRSPLNRAELAAACRLSEDETTRQVRQLERLDLLRTDPTGREVRYIVLPVAPHGFPLWHGDSIAAADAAAETREQLDRERQLELMA